MTMRVSVMPAVLLAAVLLSCLPFSTQASPESQETPHVNRDSSSLGVVWRPPAHPGPSLRQLDAIRDAGATAVRLTRIPPADTVWSRADSLGLQLFVDLPLSSVSAPVFSDSLRALQPIVRGLHNIGRRHQSLHAVGLSHATDTSDPTVCTAIQEWTAQQHDQTSNLRTYLVTPFPAPAEKCEDAVDYPLLDTRGHTSPVALWKDWQESVPRGGLGALGTWVHRNADSGLRHPHSAERQARHLEQALDTLLVDRDRTPPTFVYRWQDEQEPALPTRRYGLHDTSGTARPAASVVAGFYNGTQRVFAFPSGSASFGGPAGPILLGWGIVILLGGLYAQNTFVRQTVSRYFAAPGFYRDAVKKGRDIGPAENALLLCSVTIALGLIGTLAARIAVERPITEQVLVALPSPIRFPFSRGLTHPALAGAIVGGISLALLLVWAFTLTLAARAKQVFSFSQSLMLVTWPCWPAIPGLGIALVAATDPPVSTGTLGLLLLIGGGVSIIAVSIRVLRDYWDVSGLAFPWLLLLTLPSPLAITGLVFTWVTIEYDVPIHLIWHLLTRT